MNYYAEGGQAHGLKALAQELPKYGRGGDSMVAHINPEEAMVLKAMGGSGTINPTTGLPEFLSLGKLNPVKAISNLGNSLGISQAATKVFQPIEKAVVQPASKGLASFDKLVGNTIPGGWSTLGMMAGSAVGLPAPVMGALGAASGSGVMRPGGKFNLQGAMMGGAMAYGAAELGEYARGAADGAVNAVEKAALTSGDTAALNALSKSMEAGAGAGLQVAPEVITPSIGSNIMAGNFGAAANQIGSSISKGAADTLKSTGNFLNDATTKSTYTNALDKGLTNAGNTASGIKNLLGAGDMTAKQAGQLASASAKAAGTMAPISALGMTAYGATGLTALDEQRKYLQDQANAGAISEAEYNNALAEIERQAEIGRKAVSANPLQVNPGTEGISEGPSLYGKKESDETLYEKNPYEGATLYATGGAVNAPDDQTRMPGGSPMTNFLPKSGYTASLAEENAAMQANQTAGIGTMGRTMGGIMGGSMNSAPIGDPFANGLRAFVGNTTDQSQTSAAQTMQPTAQSTGSPQSYYGGSGAPSGINGGGNSSAFPLEGQYGIVKMAAGGMAPRFLSGGGDGMSDSIKANINGTQEARLADGEFVIPADVVSHLGNGSSKAGAKQLYSMMDRVRQARVGNKKQGKQINPRKFLAA